MKVYFSNIFDVSPDEIEQYGAFNISLINDLPLFIDPFLLFNSTNPDYQRLHNEILRYVAFLRDRSLEKSVNEGLLMLLTHQSFDCSGISFRFSNPGAPLFQRVIASGCICASAHAGSITDKTRK